MLHILLTILKITGIILLVLLGILLTVLLLVLFVPVRYRINGKKDDTDMSGRAKVSWLFGAVAFVAAYQEKELEMQLKILGINLLKLLEKKKNSKKTTKKISVSPEGKTDKLEKIEDTNDKNENVQKSSAVQKVDEHIPEPVSEKENRIKKLTIKNICDKINYWKDFLADERTKEALMLVKTHLIKLLKHILPKKIKGQIVYGFEDPCTTGQVLAGVSMLYPVYYKHLSISPDFSGAVLTGKVDLRGRIYVAYLVKSALVIFFNKNIQYTIHSFRNKEES